MSGRERVRLPRGPASAARRRVLRGVAALAALRAWPAAAAAAALPEIGELDAYLAGRTPGQGRLVLDVPRIADDGNSVSLKLALPAGADGVRVRSFALFSERNPVPTIFVIEYPAPPARAEFATRIRLAGTQRLVAVATLADGTLEAAVAEVVVAASACLDGT